MPKSLRTRPILPSVLRTLVQLIPTASAPRPLATRALLQRATIRRKSIVMGSDGQLVMAALLRP